MNFSILGNYIEVNNRIMDMWNLYGNDLNNMVVNLRESQNEFANDYSNYELDISKNLKEKLSEYSQLVIFTYETDGNVGMYENYYEKFFEMLNRNYSDMIKVIGKINQIIEKEYS